MSGSRAITLTLSVAGAAKLQEDLRQLGTAGEAALARLEAAVKKPGQGAKETGDAFGSMSQRIGQAGFQLQDFFVQIQAGTSAMTALSQQGSQFLGAFGTGGAIAGAVLTVGILAAQLLGIATNTQEIVKANEAWAKSQQAVNDLLESGIERTARLRREQVQNAALPQRQALEAAGREREVARQDVADLERMLAEARGGEGRRPAGSRVIRDIEVRLAGARDDLRTAERLADEAQLALRGIEASQFGPPASAAAQSGNPATSAILGSRDDLAAARRIAGLKGPALAIEQARIRAEAEADRVTNDPNERAEIIANRVAEARLRQAAATQELGETEAKRFAAVLAAGDAELTRSRDALELAQSLAAASTPQAAAEAQRTYEIDRSTAALRARADAATDPRVEATLRRQIDLIRLTRTEALGYQEAIVNNAARFQQGQQAGMQAAQRRAVGMAPEEAARFLGEFAEKQRIDADGRLTGDSPDALARIRAAGELAYGDEQLRQVRAFTSEVRNIGGAFAEAFSGVAFEGQKIGEVISSLEKQVAALIFRATIGRQLDRAVTMGADAIGRFFTGGSTSNGFGSYSSPIGPTISGAPMAAGGVMTSLGPLPLQRYAGGGVAHSPQVAIFGEARRPEAYVPLEDGRNIPVRMVGEGGGTSINIDARGAEVGVENRINSVLAQRMPGIVAASRLDLTNRINRGGSTARVFGRA